MNSPTYNNVEQVISAMRMGVDYTFTLSCRDFSLSARPLSVAETLEVASSVTGILAAMKNPTAANEAYVLARETLRRSTRSFDSGAEGPLQDAVLKLMTADELMHLFYQYSAGVERVNPSMETLTTEQLKMFAEHVKKSPGVMTQLSRHHLESLVLFLSTNAA